jgi:hypothetical protein
MSDLGAIPISGVANGRPADGYREQIGQSSDLIAQPILHIYASTFALALAESSALRPGQGCSEMSKTTPSGPWNLVS